MLAPASGARGSDDLLFVYGSLQRGFRNPAAVRLARSSVLLGRGTINAQLYDLGAYPGAVRSEHERDNVQGELIRLLSPALTLPALDRYELCDAASPQPHLYRRETTRVRLRCGREAIAWTYFYQKPVAEARRIPSGEWKLSSWAPRISKARRARSRTWCL